ncbi:Rossmann-like and DUF2520 domain-containing protein [Alicyclobacillus macrosporangiidus]|uniref:Predicted oxidoreductase, contains short-chain dehydrogenase (SDR) and DUF2520 domains n=1 Tax=Alicyclobacillus macrosporangiidus TaxID=392015 RepID=A0A1I7L9B6_9BACL|nr:Rossmann-like and DUF2520 domain-containing protein [Alicyclobacillus macrosporangiidus]SFV06291.1 Predicted oxidoreductase, contains short-chain dehydrogenase (SDR) and DUF2520 domains [Alicyclobacillus macrosporangiidus]
MNQFVFVGPGRIGTALTLVFEDAGYEVLGAYTRNVRGNPAVRYTSLTGRPVFDLAEEPRPLQEADAVFVTVPDKAVAAVAKGLADTGQLRPGQVVVHTAGALASSALDPVLCAGALRLSLHPLQTISDPAGAKELLRGAFCTLEGDSTAVERGQEWVQSWGGIAISIAPCDKPRYHAAAALASNGLVSLAAVAASLFPAADPLKALWPLLRGALGNLKSAGLPAALTGPVERGDLETIQLHLDAMRDFPTALRVYCALGEATVGLAFAKGSLTADERETLFRLFRSASADQPRTTKIDTDRGEEA